MAVREEDVERGTALDRAVLPPADAATGGSLVLVVPCFNEAKRLPCSAFAEAAHTACGVRLVFVDDGSTDKTREVLAALCAGAPGRCHLLTLPANVGKAEAVRRGMLHAFSMPSAYVGYLDADLSTSLDEIGGMRRVLDSRDAVQMVLGARVRLLGRNIQRRALRHYIGRLFATAASSVLRISVYDTQCGAKIMRNCPENAQLFAERFLASWIFDVEILARFLQAQGAKGIDAPEKLLYEYPLTAWRDVAGSKVRMSAYLRSAVDLLRVYLAYGMPRSKAKAGACAKRR